MALLAFAIWYSLQPEQIFGRVGDWLEDHLPDSLHKPVFDCFVCMAGIYGAALYWIIWAESIKEWLIVNIAAIGINVVISKTFPD